jgi:hypothetical protein
VNPRRVLLAGLFLVVVSCTVWVGLSYAQSAASATILGTVTDPQGNAVPDASVVAKNVDTGIERSTTTTAEGLYRIPNLAPGNYDVSVQKAGFAKALAKGIHVSVGDLRDVNFKLALGTVATEVRITAETPLVETTKTDISNIINDKQMEGLPIFPTTTPLGGNTSSKLNDYESLATLSPGVHYDASGDSFDLVGPGGYNDRGNLVNVDGGNITDQVVSTRDALGGTLDEVKEFQVITNNYTAEYGEAGNLIINVVTKSGTNAFHGAAHTFFRGRNLGASNYFYNEFDPNAAFRRARFQKQQGGIYAGGPLIKDRTFWFGNFEVGHEEDPLTLINQPPGGRSVTVVQPTHEILWTAKIDHELFKNHNLTLKFNQQRILTDNLLVQLPPFAQPDSLTTSVVHDHTINVGLTSQVTSHVVNEARFFQHRFKNALPDKTTVPGVRTSSTYSGAAFCCPQGGLQNRYQFIDNVTWTRGTHTWKFGTNISHFPYNSLFQQFHFGEWDFRSRNLAVAFGPGFVDTRDTISGVYAQDSWKIRPNLTFNYGVRYDYEDGAFRGGLVPTRGGGCLAGNLIMSVCSSDSNNFQPRVGLAWSPSFESGFLHTLFGGPGKSVVRASYAEVTELAYLNVSLDSLNFDGVTLLTAQVSFDFPFNPSSAPCPTSGTLFTNFFPNLPPDSCLATFKRANFFGRVRPIAPDLHNPEVRHFGLDISRQIGNDLVVDVGYIGVLGFGQFGERDRNFPTINPDPAHPGFFFLGARPDSRFLAKRTNENSRTSAYHGGYVNVTKRFAHHFQAQGNYTYSKTLTTTEDFFGTSEPGDPRNIRADRGPSQNDLRHVGNFSLVADTAKLMKPSSIFGHIVNNISFGLIGAVHSGTHYPISTGEGPFSGSVFPGIGAETQQRPNVLPDGTLIATNVASRDGGNLQVGGTTLGAISPNCNCPVTTFFAPAGASPLGPTDSFTGGVVDFQFLNGNLQRNVGVGSRFYRFDVSIAKTVTIRERIGLEFRANIVNVLNHPNFILFNGSDVLDNLSIGTLPSGLADPNCTSCIRAAGPLAGRYIGSNGQVLHLSDLQHGKVSPDLRNPIFGSAAASVGDPTAADLPRQIELSFRVKW